MDDQDPERRKRFELKLLDNLIRIKMVRTARVFVEEANIEYPPISINTPPPAAQNKGKSTAGPGTQYNQPQVSQSGFNHNNPLPPFSPRVVEIPKYLSQQEASSSAPRMFGSSSQFRADAYSNLPNSIGNTIWFGSPPLPINTTTTPAAQNKGKYIVGSGTQYVQPQVSQSGFGHNNPLAPFPPGVPAYVQPLSQQDASSSAPRMTSSSSQFPVDAYLNLQNSMSDTDFQLVQSLLCTPCNEWSDISLQLAVQRRMQYMLHLLPLMINTVLKSRSMAQISPFGAPMFETRDSHDFARQAGMNYSPLPIHVRPQFGEYQIRPRLGERVISSYLREADTEQQPKKKSKSIGFETQDDQHQVSPFPLYHNWVGELVPVVNTGNNFSRQLEVEFLYSSTVDGLEDIGRLYEICLESESQFVVNALWNLPNPVSTTIWSESDIQQVLSLMQTPYFKWNNTGFELALHKMRQLVLRLLLLKMDASQISPFPGQQAIPPNARFPAPQRQREISPQHSSTNNGQNDGNSNTGEVDGSFDLNKQDDTTED